MADELETKPRKPGKRAQARKRDEDPVGKVYDSRLMRRLARYVKPYWLQATISSLSVLHQVVLRRDGPDHDDGGDRPLSAHGCRQQRIFAHAGSLAG